MSELLEKQFFFTRRLASLIAFAYSNGFKMTLGEAYRTPEQAQIYAKQGKGIANSLHISRLAIDLNLFKDGVQLTKTSDYLPLGEYWETLSFDKYKCCWGGRFKSRPDGNHFSVEHNGIK